MRLFKYILISLYLIAGLVQEPYHDITEILSNVPGNITLCSETYDVHETYKVLGDMNMNGYNVSVMAKITLIVEGDVYKDCGEIITLDDTAHVIVVGQIYD